MGSNCDNLTADSAHGPMQLIMSSQSSHENPCVRCNVPIVLEGWPFPFCVSCHVWMSISSNFPGADPAVHSAYQAGVNATLAVHVQRNQAAAAHARRELAEAAAAAKSNARRIQDAAQKVLKRQTDSAQKDARRAKERAYRAAKKLATAASPVSSASAQRRAVSRQESPISVAARARTGNAVAHARARVEEHQAMLDKLNLMNAAEMTEATNNTRFPGAVSEQHVAHVSGIAAAALNSLDVVCVVCDCWVALDDETTANCAFSFFAQPNVKSKLSAAAVVPPLAPEILAHYDLSHLHVDLTGLLLSTHRFAQVPPTPPLVHSGQLYVCIACHSSLMGESPCPPTDAIANNNAIGILPETLRDSSWAEKALVSLVYGKAWIVVLKGGAQKALRGHTLTVEMDPGAVAQRLPRAAADCMLKVIIAGALTPVQKMATMRTHQVRKSRVQELLDFFKMHNPLYRHVRTDVDEMSKIKEEDSLIDMQGLAVEGTILSQPAPEPIGNDNLAQSITSMSANVIVVSDADIASSRPAGRSLRLFTRDEIADDENINHDLDASDDSLNCPFRHVSRVSVTASGPSDDALLDARPNRTSAGGSGSSSAAAVASSESGSSKRAEDDHDSIANVFEASARALEERFSRDITNSESGVLAVRTGERLVPEYARDILCMSFPSEFPFARGDFSEIRRKPMSRASQVKRCLRLSWCTFGSTSFVLKAYNMIARAEAAKKAYIRVQLGDLSFNGLTAQQMEALMRYQMECSVALRSHSKLPDPPSNLSETAKSLFRTTEVCAGVMAHTDQYAKKFGRVRVFSMWSQFGSPTLMITLNPNDLASLVLLHYAGRDVRDEGVQEPGIRRAALADSPVAAALAFWRHVSIFIRHVIGWDLKRHTAAKKGGFFGLPIALFGAVEEQNRGSLHLHLLVWISGAVPLVLQDKRMLPADWSELRHQMGDYVESIMTAEVQCPKQFHACPREALHAPVGVLPLPAEAPAAAAESAMVDVPAASESASAAAAASPAADVSCRTAHTIDIHFGQVKAVRQYRRPLKAANNGFKTDPPIAVCTQVPSGVPGNIPFGVQALARASVTAARKDLGMIEVDLTTKEAFHRWSMSTGPIEYLAPPARAPTDCDAVDSPIRQEHHAYLCFIVDLATVQLGCMAHDPAHNATCVKNGSAECRFHFPFVPHSLAPGQGPVEFVYTRREDEIDVDVMHDSNCIAEQPPNGVDDAVTPASRPIGLEVTLRRGGLSAYQNACNLGITALFRCNNDIKYVQDPGTGYYVTLYHVKTHDEESKHFEEMLAALERSQRWDAQSDAAITADSSLVNSQTSSLRLVLRATRAATSGATVSAMFAAYLSLGLERFICSEEFAYLQLGSAERYVLSGCKSISASLVPQDGEQRRIVAVDPDPESNQADPDQPGPGNKGAFAVTAFHDYLYRSVELEQLSWYELVSFYERAPKVKPQSATKSKRKLNWGLSAADEQSSGATADAWKLFQSEHPLSASCCLKRRESRATPIVYGERLPDVRELERLEADVEAQDVYGIRAMLLFCPFRLADLRKLDPALEESLALDREIDHESPWQVWTRRSTSLRDSDDHVAGRLNLVRIKENMQSYWMGVERKRENRADDLSKGGVEWDHSEDDSAEATLTDDEHHVDFLSKVDEAAAQVQSVDAAQSVAIKQLLTCGVLDSLPNASEGTEAELFAACISRSEFATTKKNLKLDQSRRVAAVMAATNAHDQLQISSVGSVHPAEACAANAAAPTEREPEAPRADWIPAGSAQELPATAALGAEIVSCISQIQNARIRHDAAETESKTTADAVKLLRHVIGHSDYTLNAKQTQLFLLFGQQFLSSCFGVKFDKLTPPHAQVSMDAVPQVENLHASKAGTAGTAAADVPNDQILAYLGGAAGTGKSRVIGAIRYLYQIMGKGASVVITATTGAAAVCLSAATVHTALGLMREDMSTPPAEMMQRFAEVRLIVVDEVSMLGEQMMNKLNKRLRALKFRTRPFGGFSVLFTGDFCQFPPVNATSLMSPRDSTPTLWRTQIRTVILLDEVKRAQQDLEFVKHLDTFRHGRVTTEAIAFFNQRVMQSAASDNVGVGSSATAAATNRVAAAAMSHSGDSSSITPRMTPIVVAENRDRVMLNTAICINLFQQYKSRNNTRSGIGPAPESASLPHRSPDTPFFRINAVYFQSGEKSERTTSGSEIVDPKFQTALSAAKVNGYDHHLRLFIGMEVVVTTNLCVELGIANGSRASVVRVQLFEESIESGHSKRPVDRRDEHGFRTFKSTEVAFIHLHLLRPNGTQSCDLLEDGLAPGVFRVSVEKDYLTDLKKQGGLLHGRSAVYSMVQFPIISAHCITGHKVQGQTLPRLILSHEPLAVNDAAQQSASSVRPKRKGKAPATPRFLYVALSRLQGRSGLTLMQPLPLDPKNSVYKLGKDLEGEIARLAKLERETLERHRPLLEHFGVSGHGHGQGAATAHSAAAGTAQTEGPTVTMSSASLNLFQAYNKWSDRFHTVSGPAAERRPGPAAASAAVAASSAPSAPAAPQTSAESESASTVTSATISVKQEQLVAAAAAYARAMPAIDNGVADMVTDS